MPDLIQVPDAAHPESSSLPPTTSTFSPPAGAGQVSGPGVAPRSTLDPCVYCREPATTGQTVQTISGWVICPRCRDERNRHSADCDSWTPAADPCLNQCPDDDDNDDDDDYDDDDDDYDDDDDDDGELVSALIHDYWYKPRPQWHGEGPLFLGLELETEIQTGRHSGPACVDLAQRHLGSLGYLKHDDSLEGGFEIVTHPMSYTWAIENFPWRMLTRLKDAGCRVSSNTGLHVHLSRTGFTSDCHVYRWMKFIYSNEAQVTTLARRSSPEWAAFTPGDRQAVKEFAKGAHGERHRAVNTQNAETFELRVFASSLDSRDVQAALALADASVEYTRQLSAHTIIRRAGWSWAAFAGWLHEQSRYEPLLEQMEALACAC